MKKKKVIWVKMDILSNKHMTIAKKNLLMKKSNILAIVGTLDLFLYPSVTYEIQIVHVCKGLLRKYPSIKQNTIKDKIKNIMQSNIENTSNVEALFKFRRFPFKSLKFIKQFIQKS